MKVENNYNKFDKIDKYFKNLINSEQYSFSEAKIIYLQILSTSDKEEKLELRNKLINGTLYKLSCYIKYNLLFVLESSFLSIEDIINDCLLNYVEFLDSNSYLNFDSFFELFNHVLITRFNNKYVSEISNKDIYKRYLIDLLVWFSEEKEKSVEVSYVLFYNYCKSINDIDDYIIFKMYMLVNDIYEKLYSCGININNNITKLALLKKLLVYVNFDKYVFVDSYYNISTMELDKILNELLSDELRNCLYKFSSNKNVILQEIFGFDSYEHSFEEIAKDYGVSIKKIKDIYNLSIKDFVKTNIKELKKIKKFYD